MPKHKIFFIILIFALTTGNSWADECMKKVFYDYCLGGDIKELLKNTSPDKDITKRGVRHLFYKDGEEMTMVTGWNGKIIAVAKLHKPASWMNYYQFKSKLKEKYGDGKDESHFPEYANSEISKRTAIELGNGQAQHAWDQGEWKVILTWSDSDLGISISYHHRQLYSEMQENLGDGL